MASSAIVLSKSRLKRGLQCVKSLFLTLYRKELEPPIDVATQSNFDEGNLVGDKAREFFPGGTLIDTEPWERDEGCRATKAAIDAGSNTIFEASFMADGLYARLDVFTRSSVNDPWTVIEVKKAARLNDEYIEDVALQALVMRAAGIAVESYKIMHLNPECVFPDLTNLFVIVDVTNAVHARLPDLTNRIALLRGDLSTGLEPAMEIGSHCDKPYECAFKLHCWADFPSPSVFDLPNIGAVKGWKLITGGKRRIEDLNPEDYKNLTRIAIEASQSGQRWIEPEGFRKAVDQWSWPLYFLDFETLAPAIPRYDGCSPYTDVPCQFSCHVWSAPNAELTHFEYLHLEQTDPRPPIAKALAQGIGPTGSVVAYNMSVERGVLQKLAEACPESRDALLSIAARLVDPLPVFKSHVYDPKFLGSFSIKSVAPVLVGEHLNYDRLVISDGLAARGEVERYLRGGLTEAAARDLREALLVYCRQDTLAMVELTKWMMSVGV